MKGLAVKYNFSVEKRPKNRPKVIYTGRNTLIVILRALRR